MENPPLLITVSLDPGATPMVSLGNVHERALRHMEGLLAWLKDSRVNQIVFAKNCRAQIRVDVLVKTAREHGKEMEFIQIDSSPRTTLQGKGFGEGDMIKQVLERSMILRNADEFIKVTGKLYVPCWEKIFTGSTHGEFFESDITQFSNKNILRSWAGGFYKQEVGSRLMSFLKHRMRIPWGIIAATPRGWIDTRIYRVNKVFYCEKLLRSHNKVQDTLNYTLENAFFDDLSNCFGIRRIKETPVIIGMSGSLGTGIGCFSQEILHQAVILNGQLFKK
jgi:hypothetical protein